MAPASAAPRAALVMDARNGAVLFAENADAPRHPASLTKMMTLYLTFRAVEFGAVDLDDMVEVSTNAAAERGSRLGLSAGQSIAVRHLVRAVAVKSANDASTALAEAVAGTEDDFVAEMNRMAAAMGLTGTSYRNAHGLTAEGHLTTARDMSELGRRLHWDFPEYRSLYTRRTADAGVRVVSHTNRRFLGAYPGADGIKTGYTSAAGYTLTASARRGEVHLIATVMGAPSSAARAAWAGRLLDQAFGEVPTLVALRPPAPLRAAPILGRPSGDQGPPGAALGLLVAARPLRGAIGAAEPVGIGPNVAAPPPGGIGLGGLVRR
ncbi:MAG: D-alanyl-D-alanine carboxypeptidase family protein [Pseudomonadota bacterium]